MAKSHKQFVAVGKALTTYGCDDEKTLDAHIKEMTNERRVMCLLTAIVSQMTELNIAISALPSRMAKAQLAEERALEKEKQKTALAQEKANAALPPVVNEITVPREVIEMAFNNRRVNRRF